VAALAVGALIVPTADASSSSKGKALHDQQKQVKTQEKQTQQDLDGESQALIKANAALASAERQLGAAQAHLASVDRQLAAAKKADQVLQGQLATAKARLATAQSAVKAGRSDVDDQRVAAQTALLQGYLHGDPSLQELQTLVEGRPLSALTSQEAYGAAVGNMQTNAYQQLESSQVLLAVHADDLKDAAAAVASAEKAAAAKVAEITGLQQQAAAAQQAVASLVASRRTARAEAAATKAQDRTKLAQLQKKEAQIQKQILAQAKHDVNRSVATTTGMFLPPVANTYITSPYGWRIHPIYHYWGLHDGDDLHAPCGTPEVAVGTGKVISEYYSDVWGNRLYLDLGRINGHSYTAIYNHISVYKSHVGEVVGRGQTVSLAGTTGWSTGCHIHFTIMKDGTAVDPTHLIGM